MTVKHDVSSVLVVDDEMFIRNLTKRVLNGLGIEDVWLAEDGHEALEMLDSKGHPDVVMSDLQMPGMDGVEFLRHLGKRGVHSAVILMSGATQRVLDTTESLARSHELKILGTIPKPVKLDSLRKLLEHFEAHPAGVKADGGLDALTPTEISDGIERGCVHVVYQPKVAVQGRVVEGVEALARWRHPIRGILGPGSFIGVAEEHGLIDRLTEEVFRKAMVQAGQWRAEGLDVATSVNFSADTLNRYDLPEMVLECSKAEGVDPSKVILEVTESRMISDIRAPLEILTRLGLHGIGLSIDDFGTGHSSMQQISRIPFTELKIDRSFVIAADRDAAVMAILESSIALARSLNLHSVAEGVETQQQWDLVASRGCDSVQGFFVSRPIEGNEIPEFVKRWEAGE